MVVIFILVVSFAALIAWLQLSYEPEVDASAATPPDKKQIVVALPQAVKAESGTSATASASPNGTTSNAAEGPVKAPAPDRDPPTATATAPKAPSTTEGTGSANTSTTRPAPSWREFARSFVSATGRPRIAIVIWDLGLSNRASNAAIEQLPGEITLGLSPVAREPQAWADKARQTGHEVLLQVPMEPLNFPDDDPGPDALLTFLPPEENLARLERLLTLFTGYVGVANYMGSRFTGSERDMRPVLELVQSRGLIFLDSRAASNSVAYRIAGEIGLDRAINSRYIDNNASRAAIDARLGELERLAQSRGMAIGIGAPFPVTIERLARWIPTLVQKNIDLAPLSAAIKSGTAQ